MKHSPVVPHDTDVVTNERDRLRSKLDGLSSAFLMSNEALSSSTRILREARKYTETIKLDHDTGIS